MWDDISEKNNTMTKLQFSTCNLRAAWHDIKPMSSGNCVADALKKINMELVGLMIVIFPGKGT